MLTAKTSKRL